MIWIIVVGLIWGLTNTFMEKGTKKSLNLPYLPEFFQTFLHPRFFIPFILNQAGSVLYSLQLGQTPLKLAVPIANSTAFLVTILLDKRSMRTYFGASLVILGISLCLNS
ncbi:unnamed protein product [Blepharisma stoltei]|uniref:Transmembrane protein 234 n=1 Tax=Blepharisma stoltei TaxID=1481888 RepID=A0AAU9K5B8_9CILI|nr:unnamed protein product [Blepharisma stoltei]